LKVKRKMKIGELAKKTGMATSAIRFYEERGLLPMVARGENGYRLYPQETVERLRELQVGKTLGLSLETMRGMFTGQGGCAKARVLELMEVRLHEVEAMQASLAEQHRKLVAVRDMLTNALESGAAAPCQSFAG
jgi:MerR family copper efflux transcriptional regulator